MDTTPTILVTLDTIHTPHLIQNPFIEHKTTQRDIYNQSRERTHCEWNSGETGNVPFDVILYNQYNQITETSIANIAIKYPQQWKTPHSDCGKPNP
ncbi:hypothetical protein BDB01DRAFT_784160 [Pilobolus umbonatus]|nr:hypothetical protein BDB01DRAFT_784160 [Pilobolus umbonatus]